MVSVLAIAKEGRRDASWVFTHFESNSGWTSGWSFMVGLLHAAYATSSTGMIISYVAWQFSYMSPLSVNAPF